jgi:DNA polymerase III delta subunit
VSAVQFRPWAFFFDGSPKVAQAFDPEKVLKKILEAPQCPSALLIAAPDQIRKNRARDAVLERFIGPRRAAVSPIQKIDARELGQDKIDFLAQEVNSLTLFASERFIVIEHVDKLNAALSRKLLGVIEQAPPAVALILMSDKALERGPLSEHFHAAQTLIMYEDLKPQDLRLWIKNEIARAGINKHSAQLVDLIANAAQGLPDEAARIIEQLALYVDGGQVLDQDFYQLFVEVPDPKDYELLDAIERKDFVKAEVTLEGLLAAGKSPMLLLSNLYRTYSNYLLMLDMLAAGRGDEHISRAFGLKPWLLQKQLSTAKRYTIEKVRTKLNLILIADSKLKNRSLGADAICSELIYQLAA